MNMNIIWESEHERCLKVERHNRILHLLNWSSNALQKNEKSSIKNNVLTYHMHNVEVDIVAVWFNVPFGLGRYYSTFLQPHHISCCFILCVFLVRNVRPFCACTFKIYANATLRLFGVCTLQSIRYYCMCLCQCQCQPKNLF